SPDSPAGERGRRAGPRRPRLPAPARVERVPLGRHGRGGRDAGGRRDGGGGPPLGAPHARPRRAPARVGPAALSGAPPDFAAPLGRARSLHLLTRTEIRSTMFRVTRFFRRS